MFGIGGNELILILLFGFLIFGPDKLPAMAKTLGKAINKFRSAQEEMNKVIKTEVYDPTSDEPFKNPLEALSKVGKDDKEEKTESFSERKAKYDKERAAKKAAEAEKAEKAEGGEAAATATAAAATTAAVARRALRHQARCEEARDRREARDDRRGCEEARVRERSCCGRQGEIGTCEARRGLEERREAGDERCKARRETCCETCR